MRLAELNQTRLQAKAIVEEIIGLLSDNGIPNSRRLGKEIAWEMADEEEGEAEAFCNIHWMLQMKDLPALDTNQPEIV